MAFVETRSHAQFVRLPFTVAHFHDLGFGEQDGHHTIIDNGANREKHFARTAGRFGKRKVTLRRC
jgi:hypothetical protein